MAAGGGAVWAALVLGPLVCLGVSAWGPVPRAAAISTGEFARLLTRTAIIGAAVAAGSVLLGWVPGRILGTARRGRAILSALVLAPLLLPRYVLYYAWWLLRGPTSPLGRWLVEQPAWAARAAAMLNSGAVLVFWFWPLAALLLAQGWRGLDAEVFESAELEGGRWRRLTRVTLPLLARPLAMAFAVSFVLLAAEYGTFHLASVETISVRLAALYKETGSTGAVARMALPITVLAAAVSVGLSRQVRDMATHPPLDWPAARAGRWAWAFLAALVGVSLAMPAALFLANLEAPGALAGAWASQREALAASLTAGAVAAALALAMAAGVLAAEHLGRPGRAAAHVMQVGLLLALLLPGWLVAAGLRQVQAALDLPAAFERGFWIVSAGHAARFGGVVLIVLRLARDPATRHFQEMAGVDGAGWFSAWRYVQWPRVWPVVVAAAALVVMFSLTEVPASMVLLPPGVDNVAQGLVNRMHGARDQEVMVTALLLMAMYLVPAFLAASVAAVKGWRWAAPAGVVLALVLLAGGCGGGPGAEGGPDVAFLFGSSGRGPGEFLYPRAIDLDARGQVYVADRTGRIQRFSPDGRPLGVIQLPDFEQGYPTGITVGPDGNLYVADTHYHRVLVYAPDGRLLRRLGRFGTGDGQFIYPTDVALAGGRIYVSEYGGNDRISIYGADGSFERAFGRPGGGEGEFSRPSALAVDEGRGIVYVADACNHRIARYTLSGELRGYIGSLGAGTGQLRYPYGLALLPGGTLLVCEYGNNRIQAFSPEGRGLKCLGRAGRSPGQLAYPWGVAADASRRIYVVDSGNNRIQVWRP